MLEHMIDWDFIRDYEPVKRRLADTVSLLRDLRIHTTEELNDGIETVLELFSPDSQ